MAGIAGAASCVLSSGCASRGRSRSARRSASSARAAPDPLVLPACGAHSAAPCACSAPPPSRRRHRQDPRPGSLMRRVDGIDAETKIRLVPGLCSSSEVSPGAGRKDRRQHIVSRSTRRSSAVRGGLVDVLELQQADAEFWLLRPKACRPPARRRAWWRNRNPPAARSKASSGFDLVLHRFERVRVVPALPRSRAADASRTSDPAAHLTGASKPPRGRPGLPAGRPLLRARARSVDAGVLHRSGHDAKSLAATIWRPLDGRHRLQGAARARAARVYGRWRRAC